MQTKLEIFFSYADEDEHLRKKLENHLSILRQQKLIAGWHRRNISAGMEQMSEINSHLNTAQIILLLISPNFMASEYCYSVEMEQAMQRHTTGKARVIPIILRAIDYGGAPFDKLKALPENGIAVTSWSNQDEAFFNIVQNIRTVMEEISINSLASSSISIPYAQEQVLPGQKEKTYLADEHALVRVPSANALSTSVEYLERFDVFLSHSPIDAQWVEKNLAQCLADDYGLRVWLDQWELIPGELWQPALAHGLDQANCCIVCIGEQTSRGWFQLVIQRAQNRQAHDPSFRVIPVFLPNAKSINIDNFLELNTWIDFRVSDQSYAFHLLFCGIKGMAPGRWPSK